MNLRNEILSIASDLREGSMSTDEAVKQLRELLNCSHPFNERYLYNGYTHCKLCGQKWPDSISGLMKTSDEEVKNELYKRILNR